MGWLPQSSLVASKQGISLLTWPKWPNCCSCKLLHFITEDSTCPLGTMLGCSPPSPIVTLILTSVLLQVQKSNVFSSHPHIYSLAWAPAVFVLHDVTIFDPFPNILFYFTSALSFLSMAVEEHHGSKSQIMSSLFKTYHILPQEPFQFIGDALGSRTHDASLEVPRSKL